MKPQQIRILAGPHHRRPEIEIAFYSSDLEEIKIHENFSRSSLENNIAVGILAKPFTRNDQHISALDLKDVSIFPPSVNDSNCKIYGWSLTTKYETLPHLLSGDVVIEEKEKCDVTGNKVASTTICAGPNYVNGCETDAGGPLVCSNFVIALIDYRPPNFCSRIQNVLGTYVGLAEFHSWIADQTGGSAMISLKFSLIVMAFLFQFSRSLL